MADYELVFIVDPRLSDEDTVGISDAVKELLTSLGATVAKEESWGKRKLAYEINNLTEGKYFLFHVDVPKGTATPFVEVEHRLHQNEKILRYLTVRMDEGRLRRRSVPVEPAAEPVAASE